VRRHRSVGVRVAALLHALLQGANLTARLVETLLPIALGGAIFFVAARLLRVEELDQAVQAIAGRFRRRRK